MQTFYYIDADQKHITSLREKGYMPCAIKSTSDIIQEQRSKAMQLFSYNKTTNYF